MKKLLSFCIIIYFLTSCSKPLANSTEFLSEFGLSTNDINSDIFLVVSEISESYYQQTNLIYMQVRNNSNVPVEINLETGIKIFHNEFGKWVQIDNLMGYQEGVISLPQKEKAPMGIDIITMPDYCKLQPKELVRVVVIGRQEVTNKIVAASFDLTIVNQIKNEDCIKK